MIPHPKQLLDQHGLDAKKSLGQNFLFDEAILGRIADAAQLSHTDELLEVGAGLGHLTVQLAQRAGRVVAVELDQRLLPILGQNVAGFPQVQLIQNDILAIQPATLFSAAYKVVANVPYYITGAILRHLLTSLPRPALLVMTMQQEVAERLTAPPGHLSLLAVSVLFFGQPEIVLKIKAGAFYPRPEVDSAVVRIKIPAGSLPVPESLFFRIAKAGFSQKRKQLKNNLGQLPFSSSQIEWALQNAGIDGHRRAQTLTLNEWLALTKAIVGLTNGQV